MQAKLMEMAALATLIGSIGRQRVAFDVAVQEALVEVIGQSIVHRNITPAAQLLDVIGAHLKPVVVAHMETYGNIVWAKQEKKLKFHENLMYGAPLAWTEEYREKLIATPWVKAKKETEPKSVYDVAEETDKFLERLLKVGKKGTELKNKGLLERLVETYNRFQAETFLARTAAPTAEDVQTAKESGDKASAERLQELREKFGGAPKAVNA